MPSQVVTRSVTRKWYYNYFRMFCGGATQLTGDVTNANFAREVFFKARSWVRTPNYRTLKQQKKHLPDNAFGYQEEKVQDEIMRMTRLVYFTCTGNPNAMRYEQTSEFVPTAYFGSDRGTRYLTEAATRAKLIERAKGAEWSAPVFLGEGRETVNMVANTARTLASAMRDLRRGNLAGALGSLGIQGTASQRRRYHREFGLDPTRASANAWLSLQYGWIPLLSDVKNAAETLAENLNLEENREIRVTATARMQDRIRTPNRSMSTTPPLTADKLLEQEESCRGVWRCKPTSWNSVGSFGVLNPASVAWELLPLSFVVDWFLPIGRYLEGLDVPMRFQHLGGTIGYRRKVRVNYTNWMYYGVPQPAASHSTSWLEVSRNVLTGHPTVGLDSIVFDPKMGTPRIASALSLLRQAFR